MSRDPFTKLKQDHSPDKRRSTAALTFPLTAWSALIRTRSVQKEQMSRPNMCTLTQQPTFPLDFEVPSSKGLDVRPQKLPCCHCSHTCLFIARHIRERLVHVSDVVNLRFDEMTMQVALWSQWL